MVKKISRQQKIDAIMKAKLGEDVGTLASNLGITDKTLYNWCKSYHAPDINDILNLFKEKIIDRLLNGSISGSEASGLSTALKFILENEEEKDILEGLLDEDGE